MSKIDDIIMQIRPLLQELGIKLWLPPYYKESVGVDENELENLAYNLCHNQGIPKSYCTLALMELQERALEALKEREEFANSGIATFHVRRVNIRQGIQSIVEIKCALKSLGSELQKNIAEVLDIDEPERIKCISAGKIVNPSQSLLDQDMKNNQHLMLIISETDEKEQMQECAMFDRIKKVKEDVEAITDSKNHLLELVDQDGNPVCLPPAENRALLIAVNIYEKARAAMKHERYEEALILLLEADEKFITCSLKTLENIDNYALLNLDIVWCYLCLKNVTQLPDAQKRENFCDKALMRLHLLQGVVLFHQSKRREAYEKFLIAESELRVLKVNKKSLKTLREMGYEPQEARLALQARDGDITQAINYIHDQQVNLNETRMYSAKRRRLNQDLSVGNLDKKRINLNSVYTLIEMGYPYNLVVQALRDSKNDLNGALDLLQNHPEKLSRKLPSNRTVNITLMQELLKLGFKEPHSAIDVLIKFHNDGEHLSSIIKRMTTIATAEDIPSTSSGVNSLAEKIAKKAIKHMECLSAYKRFKEELIDNELDYLDLPLAQEEQILEEYKNLLISSAKLVIVSIFHYLKSMRCNSLKALLCNSTSLVVVVAVVNLLAHCGEAFKAVKKFHTLVITHTTKHIDITQATITSKLYNVYGPGHLTATDLYFVNQHFSKRKT
uniref:UBA domain-containing protein n=1 Tax=Glossina brevipalpis TaxID=37001 RepID=A0A1A9X3U9_9MUSC